MDLLYQKAKERCVMKRVLITCCIILATSLFAKKGVVKDESIIYKLVIGDKHKSIIYVSPSSIQEVIYNTNSGECYIGLKSDTTYKINGSNCEEFRKTYLSRFKIINLSDSIDEIDMKTKVVTERVR
jgi:hypothetical protein